MITCFQGTPGSGKSYDVVKKIHDNMKKGRVVYTNVEGMDDEDCRSHLQNILGFDDFEFSRLLIFLPDHLVKNFWEHCKSGALIVIDEIQNHFGNREWNSDANKGFCRWASTHRHYGFDLIMVTQHIERVDKAVVALVQWTYNYIKNDFMGSLVTNSYMVKVFNGDNINGKPFAKHHHQYDKKFFKCYKSYVSADIKEHGVMKKVNIFMHPLFFIIPVLFAITIYMVFFKSSLGSGDLFGTKKNLHKKPVVSAPVSATASPLAVPSFVEYHDSHKPVVPNLSGPGVLPKAVPLSVLNNKAVGENGVIPVVPACRQETEVNTGDKIIQIFICGDKAVKKINGVVVEEKKARGVSPSRKAGDTSLASFSVDKQ